MAPRPIWEGHLRLSLVTCPVSLYSAISSTGDVHFHLINPKTGNRIRTQVIDPETGVVDRRDLVRGFEVEKDRYLLLTNEDIKSVRLESTETIDIERFVDGGEIDRIWWSDPYYLAPDGKAGIEAYVVIREAMARSGRVALGRVVIGTRERLVAIEPRGKGMLVTTLRTHDEVRESTPYFDAVPDRKADAGMIEIAERIIEQQEGAFDPSSFHDRYEDALRALIEARRKGGDQEVTAPPPRGDNVIDLMEALRRSLEQKGAAGPSRALSDTKAEREPANDTLRAPAKASKAKTSARAPVKGHGKAPTRAAPRKRASGR